eukprot:12404308-Karenia_brevis.AAC.1
MEDVAPKECGSCGKIPPISFPKLLVLHSGNVYDLRKVELPNPEERAESESSEQPHEEQIPLDPT